MPATATATTPKRSRAEMCPWASTGIRSDTAAVRPAETFFFQAEDSIRDADVTGVQTCALPISHALGDIAVADVAIDFADDGGVLGLARLEEFHDARKTTGDVLGLGGFARDLGKNVARGNIVAVLHHQVRARRHQVLLA